MSTKRPRSLHPVKSALVEKTLMSPTEADLAAAETLEPLVDVSQVDVRTQEGRRESDLDWSRGTASNGEVFLPPVSDPDLMYRMFLLSAFLRPLVEAMSVNVYEADYALEPIVDLKEAEDVEALRQAVIRQTGDKELTDKTFQKVLDEYAKNQAIEYEKLKAFFDYCNPEGSYLQLRTLIGQDLEITGNSYVEVLRDKEQRITQMVWTPARYMRACPQAYDVVPCKQTICYSPLRWEDRNIQRRFRKYVQNFLGSGMSSTSSSPSSADSAVTFKELGDPRILSRATGKYYTSEAEFQKEAIARRGRKGVKWREGEMRSGTRDVAVPATEIWHIRLPFGGNSAYGVPRWAGAYPCARGSRELDEENMRIAMDDVVPSLLISVSGGRVDGKDQQRIEDQINERKAGHKRILILQARSERAAGPSPTPTIKVDKLKSEQTTDALFQNYDVRNENKLDACFRMPRALLGKDMARDRASLAAMYRYAQDQIFSPARRLYDDAVTTSILPGLGARFFRYVTQTPTPVDPEALGALIGKMLEQGILTPNESRDAVEKAINVTLSRLPGVWADIPPRMLTAVLQTKNQTTAAALVDPKMDAKGLAEAMVTAQAQADQARAEAAQAKADALKQQGQDKALPKDGEEDPEAEAEAEGESEDEDKAEAAEETEDKTEEETEEEPKEPKKKPPKK